MEGVFLQNVCSNQLFYFIRLVVMTWFKRKIYNNIFFIICLLISSHSNLGPNGSPVTQQVQSVGVTDASGNPVTGNNF